MTKPSITYGHGFFTDCDDVTPWSEGEYGILEAESELISLYRDVFRLKGVCDSGAADDEWVWAEKDITDISAITYPYYVIRWKTSESANGLGALAEVVFDDASTEYLQLKPTQTDNTIPQFDTQWYVSTGTISTEKTIDHVRFYAKELGDQSGTFYAYLDFFLICKGVFTFPNVGHGMEFTPPPRYAIIPIFGRVGDVTQGGGSELATVTCSCDLDIGRLSTTSSSCTGSDWKRPQGVDAEYKTDYVRGEALIDISHNTYREPWQWLDTGTEQFKATLETPVFRRTTSGNKAQHILDLLFREYRLSDASNESYVERFGLNL